jgi:hypothetical protein
MADTIAKVRADLTPRIVALEKAVAALQAQPATSTASPVTAPSVIIPKGIADKALGGVFTKTAIGAPSTFQYSLLNIAASGRISGFDGFGYRVSLATPGVVATIEKSRLLGDASKTAAGKSFYALAVGGSWQNAAATLNLIDVDIEQTFNREDYVSVWVNPLSKLNLQRVNFKRACAHHIKSRGAVTAQDVYFGPFAQYLSSGDTPETRPHCEQWQHFGPLISLDGVVFAAGDAPLRNSLGTAPPGPTADLFIDGSSFSTNDIIATLNRVAFLGAAKVGSYSPFKITEGAGHTTKATLTDLVIEPGLNGSLGDLTGIRRANLTMTGAVTPDGLPVDLSKFAWAA